ncbi:MAG: hypothetical protein HKP26_02365 [Nitrosopumilus sp.]|nr:hypothetical protein [Nitrosopumilus sp.]
MKIFWMMIPLIFFVILDIEKSFAEDSSFHKECISINNTKNILCNETFRPQSMEVFSVVDSSVGIFEDPDSKLLVVDLGTFYGIGGNGTIPDIINVYRDNILWKTTTKETGIAPSTSHSEWQLPQTFFFNELPGKYKLVLITNDTETFVYEFLVMQITEKFDKNDVDTNMNNNFVDNFGSFDSRLSPLKQIANGVFAKDIICNEDMQLVFKTTNGNPACVASTSVDKLIERSWAKF